MVLLKQVSTLQSQQAALGSRIESLTVASENAMAREREAEESEEDEDEVLVDSESEGEDEEWED